MKLKLPFFRPPSRSKKQQAIRQQRLEATTRRATPTAMEEYDEEEPTTRFSSAFIVVLILHLVFVAGVVTFKSMQANPKADEPAPAASKSANADQDLEPIKAAAPGAAAPAAMPAAGAPIAPLLSGGVPQTLARQQTPAPAKAPTSTPAQPASPAKAAAQAALAQQAQLPKSYHCKAGDTLGKVSAAYNIPIADICEANSWKENWPLHAGQALTIPAPKPAPKPVVVADTTHKADDPATKALAAAAAAAGGKTYTVKKGDNPMAIARNLHVSQEDLLKLNKIDDPKKLQIGAVLQVPAARKKDPDKS